ncbi:MAG TPA: phosphoribosylanthranilate isomerase [Candidatus Angelobacter sp.]
MKTWIKFCGTTSLEDALASVEAGADALGFIFAPSKRHVSLEKAQEIIRELPTGIERIGVFLEESAEQIRKTVLEADLTGIQLHGGKLAPEIYGILPQGRRDSVRIISTVLVRDGFTEKLSSGKAVSVALSAWLLDSGAGSGKTFDWVAARAQLGDRQGRFIIAGGLNPENVGEAIQIFSPWGVDVVSGIEREPGRKDPEKLKAFVAAVRKAEQQ